MKKFYIESNTNSGIPFFGAVEEYYTCDLRKERCSCVDYFGYCSDGEEKEENEK